MTGILYYDQILFKLMGAVVTFIVQQSFFPGKGIQGYCTGSRSRCLSARFYFNPLVCIQIKSMDIIEIFVVPEKIYNNSISKLVDVIQVCRSP